MLTVLLLVVGKLKEKYLVEAMAEYTKRLGAFCKFEVVELPEIRVSNNPSEAEIVKGLEQEAEIILSKVSPRAQVVSLCIEGRQISSEELGQQFQSWSSVTSQVVFIIGSSFGLSEQVKKESHLRLSMSKMTFPHQLARVMLTEQIYRGLSINHGSKYHK